MTTAGRSRLRGFDRRAVRSSLIALVSTVVVFTVLGWIIVNAPGWPEVQASFLDRQIFIESAPAIVRGVRREHRHVRDAEILVLILGLFLAVLRSLTGPVFVPVRFLATAYADVFRAVAGRPGHLRDRVRDPRPGHRRPEDARRSCGGSSP